jgi:hypothetical protein
MIDWIWEVEELEDEVSSFGFNEDFESECYEDSDE